MARKRSPSWTGGRDVRLRSAARLDFAMKEKGCNNSELARVAGMAGPTYISRMRRGIPGSRSIKATKAAWIAKYLDVEVDWLFELVEDRTSGEAKAA